MRGNIIELVDVSKRFGDVQAVKQVSLTVRRGEFLSLLGPSGCGKTTTLRMIAGFETPTSGQIIIDGQPMLGIPPYRRPVNTVFQHYALFPHMTVADNVAYGPRMRGMPRDQIKRAVAEALELVGLIEYADRYPRQLSGGQQQRVALARALVNRPKVLLLDEPLGALDLKLRKRMQIELKRIQKELGITFILVTHDQEEALAMSDRIAVMNEGRIEQVGTGFEIYNRPKTRFVADFIGQTNLFQGQVVGREGGDLVVKVGQAVARVETHDDFQAGGEVTISVRPERVRIFLEPDPQHSVFPASVKDQVYLGSEVLIMFQLPNGQEVTARTGDMTQAAELPRDRQVFLGWKPADAWVLGH